MNTRHSPGPTHAREIVAYIKSADLLGGFVKSLAAACRAGVPARVRAQVGSFYSHADHTFVDAASASRELITQEIAEAVRAGTKCRHLAEKSTDEEMSTRYVHDAERWLRLEREARRRLQDLEVAEQDQQTERFETTTELLEAALSRIASADDRFTQAERNAFQTLVPSFRLAVEPDGGWRAYATVRLPLPDGVAEIGPITWTMPHTGRGVQMIRAGRESGRSQPIANRAELVDELVEHGLTRTAALVITNSPFREPAQLVRERLLSLPPADWVGRQWRAPAFRAHLLAVYLSPSFAWDRTAKYTVQSPVRQAVVDLAEQHGTLTRAELRTVFPAASADTLSRLSEPGAGAKAGASIRPWSPMVVPTVTGRRLSVAPRTCWCGELATIVARVPEVPTDMLCAALHVASPTAPSGVAVVFPDDYRALRMSREQWLRGLADSTASRNRATNRLSVGTAEILAMVAAAPEPLPVAVIAGRLGRSGHSVAVALRKMEDRGWVSQDESWPRRWQSTSDGLTVSMQQTGASVPGTL